MVPEGEERAQPLLLDLNPEEPNGEEHPHGDFMALLPTPHPQDGRNPPFHWKAWMGDWWVERLMPEAVQIADQMEADGKKITHFQCSGPAIKEIEKVTYVQWGFAIMFPFVVVLISHCPLPWEPFAHYPSKVYLMFLPVVFYSVFCEIQAMRWMLCTICAYCAPFKIFGKRVSFNQWVLFMSGLSLATHADIVTNGLFLAKILKTVSCHGKEAQRIETIWAHVIKAAPLVNWIPGFDRIDTLLLFGWGLMFLQPVLCVAYAVPIRRKEQKVDYGVSSMMQGYTTLWAAIFKPGQDGRPLLHHADILQWLGAVNRMVSIHDKNLPWSLARAQESLDNGDCKRAVNIIEREFARVTHRLWLVNVLEKAYMLEVQVTIFAISRCEFPRDRPPWARVDGQMVLSVMLSFLTFLKVIYDASYQLMAVNKFVRERVRREEIGEAETNAKVQLQTLDRTQCGFLCGLLVLFVAFSHSVMKFVMAFVCEDSMWNVPFFHDPGEDWKGCVDLSTYLND